MYAMMMIELIYLLYTLLVTALNSAPVIFYPTDTFAELEPRFFSGRQLCMHRLCMPEVPAIRM